MTLIARNVARRFANGRILPELLKALDQLEILDENLERLETTFDMHFAALSPEVKGHLDSLNKAVDGLRTAKTVLDGLTKLVETFPDEKGAVKAKVEAERMVERFERHIAKTHKIVQTLSSKAMPKALKAMAAKTEKLIQARMVNPGLLQVIPWQDGVLRDAPYMVIFRIVSKDIPGEKKEIRLEESISSTEGPMLVANYSTMKATADKAAETFIGMLRGWSGIKGEADAAAARKATAEAIQKVLTRVTNQLGWMTDPTQISDNFLMIEGSYRSNLPKEGAYAVGEYKYDEMVREEKARCQKAVDAQLAPYKDKIKALDIGFGEKSWVYITVNLK